MSRLFLPQSPDELTKRLKSLHEVRREVQKERKKSDQEHRRHLTNKERTEVLEKTDKHCHLCGGDMNQTSSDVGALEVIYAT